MSYMPAAFFAGVCGASGALSAKFAFGTYSYQDNFEMFSMWLIAFVAANILMWWAYTTSLRRASSTIEPLVINLGTNFVLSGIFGFFFFSEVHSTLWWIGLSTVIVGISVIATSKEKID